MILMAFISTLLSTRCRAVVAHGKAPSLRRRVKLAGLFYPDPLQDVRKLPDQIPVYKRAGLFCHDGSQDVTKLRLVRLFCPCVAGLRCDPDCEGKAEYRRHGLARLHPAALRIGMGCGQKLRRVFCGSANSAI